MYFCYQCSSRYPAYLAWCSVCQDSGTILVEPKRPRARARGALQSASARDLVSRKWTMVESSAYPELRVGRGALVGVYGQPGGGKSTFCTRYVDGLSGAVVYFSAEEGLGPTVGARLERCGVTRGDFHLVGQAALDELCDLCRDVRARALVVDSVQMTTLRPTELRGVLEDAQVGVLLFVMHATKDGQAAGLNSWLHEADVLCEVSGLGVVLRKSRYQSLSSTPLPVL